MIAATRRLGARLVGSPSVAAGRRPVSVTPQEIRRLASMKRDMPDMNRWIGLT
jgi:hypothetical protein